MNRALRTALGRASTGRALEREQLACRQTVDEFSRVNQTTGGSKRGVGDERCLESRRIDGQVIRPRDGVIGDRQRSRCLRPGKGHRRI